MSDWHYYLSINGSITRVVRIKSKRRPSVKSIPKSGTWHPVQELVAGSWQMASYPEITWGAVKKLTYLGKPKPPA